MMKGRWTYGLAGALMLACLGAYAQDKPVSQVVYKMPKEGNFMRYLVEDGDTVYIAKIRPSYCVAHGKAGRNWRDYYRLVHNFGKVYNYALEAGRLKREIDSTYAAAPMTVRMQEKYIGAIQNELLDKYEPVLREMTYSQGKLLIRLIDRETGVTPYDIIRDYKSSAAAVFWQGIAKLFEGDLKTHYDPQGKDRETEELIDIWNKGEYTTLYQSIFGKDPEIGVVPRYGKKAMAQQEKAAKKAAREAERARKAEEKAAKKAAREAEKAARRAGRR